MKQKHLRQAVWLILTSQFSSRAIGLKAGFHHSTIQEYRKKVIALNLSVERLDELNDEQLAGLFAKTRERDKSKRMPDMAAIHKELPQKGMTLLLLWYEYVLEDPDTAYSYSQFTHYYNAYIERIDVTMRQTHYAGEECFIDFAGKTIEYYCETLKTKRPAQVFVAVMGCSDLIFARACKSQQLEEWIDAHCRLFNYLGGVPAILVPDNLRSAVTKPGKIPELNRTYENMGAHYGCHIFPARVRKPKDKSKAELAVKLVTRWIIMVLRHRQFFSLDEINDAIGELLEKLNQRPFKRLPGCRRSRFEEFDKPMLKPLPQQPFEYGEWSSKLKVNSDYHVYVDQHAYSVPYKLVAQKVEARSTASHVEIYYLSKRVAIHQRSDVQGGHTTNPAHRPASHAAYVRQKEEFLDWAKKIGAYTVTMVDAQFAGHPDFSSVGFKACDQLQALNRRYGAERFESACQHSINLGSLTIKTLRSTLQSGVDQLEQDIPIQMTLPIHENVRGASYFSGGEV